jgi:hypothetical protein
MYSILSCTGWCGKVFSALISLSVDSIALPLAHRHDQHQQLAIPHVVDQTETSGEEFDLGVMTGSPPGSLRSGSAIPAVPRDERPAHCG